MGETHKDKLGRCFYWQTEMKTKQMAIYMLFYYSNMYSKHLVSSIVGPCVTYAGAKGHAYYLLFRGASFFKQL